MLKHVAGVADIEIRNSRPKKPPLAVYLYVPQLGSL